MLARLIIFLVRIKLGLKKYERFQFVGQKSDAMYYFTKRNVMKICGNGYIRPSGVSINWLVNEDCEVAHCDILTKELMKND